MSDQNQTADFDSGNSPSTAPHLCGHGFGPGSILDGYKILSTAGEGGFGVVYLAESERPVRRRVALKVIKPGMDSKQVIARFDAERQALAIMDHPNVARIFDAGMTQSGQSYFVMEYVKGVPITEHCDRCKSSIEDRLKLFIDVCEAVQHAHQKGIIHRDLKPSNILVRIEGERAIAKVIDFGVSKAIAVPLTEKTLFTEMGQIIGTPEYMSPEQAEMTGQDIDTRTDIYSLGVVLYQLLTGCLPFSTDYLRKGGLDHLRRVIRDEVPKSPSTKVSTLDHVDRQRIAESRKIDLAELRRALKGDLDWIVLKAIEKERTRRYETAHDLAKDVQRYFDHEPIVARPPSTSYRVRKAIRRHRAAFFSGIIVTAALLFGLFASVTQAIRATLAEKEENRLRQQAESAESKATEVAYAAEIGNGFRSLEEGNLFRARYILDRYRPVAGKEDLRGFEWRYLWKLCQSQQLDSLPGDYSGGIQAVRFSTLANTLIIGGNDLQVLDLASRQSVFRTPHGSIVLSLSKDGSLLAAATEGEVTIWDCRTWTLVKALSASCPAALSPDGKLLAAFADGGYTIWNTTTWEKAGTVPGRPAFMWGMRKAVTFSNSGELLVTPSYSDEIRDDWFQVWKVPELVSLGDFRPKGPAAASVAFLPGDTQLVTGLWDGRVVVWDVSTRTPIKELKHHNAWVSEIAVSHDGTRFATSSADGTISVWDAFTHEHLGKLTGSLGEVWGLDFSPSGEKLISGGIDLPILWPASPRQQDDAILGGRSIVGFSGDSRTLVSSNASGALVTSLATRSTKAVSMGIVGQSTHPASDAIPMAITGNEPMAIVGKPDGTIEIWDLRAGNRTTKWNAHVDSIDVLALSPSGRLMATGDDPTGDVAVWNVMNQQELCRFSKPVWDGPFCIAFSPDEKYIAAGFGNGKQETTYTECSGS